MRLEAYQHTVRAAEVLSHYRDVLVGQKLLNESGIATADIKTSTCHGQDFGSPKNLGSHSAPVRPSFIKAVINNSMA